MFHTILRVLSSIILFSSLLFATADGPDYWAVRGVASNDVLWVHPVPDYHSKKIGSLPYNATCIRNLGCRGNRSRWCKIEYQGHTGWVNGKYLGENGHCP